MSKITIQKILQQHGPAIMRQYAFPLHYLKAIDKLSACRTAALGGHAQYCENDHLHGIWYNSCKHRACPQCRRMPTEEWLTNTKNLLLNCAHHHIVFTLPAELNKLWRYNQAILTDILFQAAQQTLQQFAKDPKYLDATPGILCALHTWGRSLSLHPHIHALVSHGGTDQQGQWVIPKKGSLFPQKPVMMVYRGKLLSLLKTALTQTAFQVPPDTTVTQIRNLINKLGRRPWVVHFCQRYDHAMGVAKYLSRYVKSGPLKNQQITNITAECITYRYQSHQTKKREKLTLTIGQFIKRLLQHIPLPGKPTVRYCGLYHSAARKRLNQARQALGQSPANGRKTFNWQEYMASKDCMPVCRICNAKITKRKSLLPQPHLA